MLLSRAWLKERISRHRKQPLILHADNGNALAAGLRVAIEGGDAGGATGRAGFPHLWTGMTTSTDTAASSPQASAKQWFVTPKQRYLGEAVEICRHRARVYEQARQRHPRRWTGAPRCWRQPEVVWINLPADDFVAQTATLALAA